MKDVAKLETGDLAERINEEHHACEAAAGTAVAHAINAVEMVVEAKSKCSHGEWIPWLENNFVGAPRTAQAYMKLYSRRAELAQKRNSVAHLPLREALKELASPVEKEPGAEPADDPEDVSDTIRAFMDIFGSMLNNDEEREAFEHR